MSNKSSIVAIFKEFLSSYPWHFSLLFFLLVAEGAAAAMSVLAFVPLADFLLDPALSAPSRITQFVVRAFSKVDVPPSFWLFGFLFVALTALKCLVEIALRYSITSIKYAVMGGLIDDALHAFFRARWTFFSSIDSGRLMNTLNRELPNIVETLGMITTQMAEVIQLASYLAVPFWLHAEMTATALGLALLLGAPFMLLHSVSYRLGTSSTESGNVLMIALNEVLGAARLILGFGRQAQARNRYLGAYRVHAQAILRSQTLHNTIRLLYRPLAILAAVIAMGLAIHQQTRFSELGAVMWSLLAAVPILSSLLQGNIAISNFLPSYEQLLSLRRSAEEFVEIEGRRIFTRLDQGIELIAVDFTYPGRAQTLTEINLHIRKGQMVALVGESGSGKSTVTDIVLGFQIPEKGKVLLDGVPLGDWKQNSFRERIGYVPQDPLLFHATIRDNLLWSLEYASEIELWTALQLANAAGFVKELPDGIDTVVGDRGVRLSGGQRQRIALARAMLRKPDLLILDEATSALDSESERLIQQSIERVACDTTVLVVAHRLSTIAKADQVYVMREGRVIEEGAYSMLSAKPGSILSAMIAAQHPLEPRSG